MTDHDDRDTDTETDEAFDTIQECIDDLSEPLSDFLRVHVMEVGRRGLALDYVPPSAAHLGVTQFPMQRAVLPFLREGADLAEWSADLHQYFRKEGGHYYVSEEDNEIELEDDEGLFSYLMYDIGIRVLSAWMHQLFSSMCQHGTPDQPYLRAVQIDGDMLPPERDAFAFILHEEDIDIDVALQVLRSARKTLTRGEVLPKCLAEVFLVSTTTVLN